MMRDGSTKLKAGWPQISSANIEFRKRYVNVYISMTVKITFSSQNPVLRFSDAQSWISAPVDP
jgi:hypothetical protein